MLVVLGVLMNLSLLFSPEDILPDKIQIINIVMPTVDCKYSTSEHFGE